MPESQTWLAEQAVPHAPQCVGSFWRFTHAVRPVNELTTHAERPVSHVVLQPPRLQWLLALRIDGHVLPQAPQLFGSLCSSTQLLLQLLRPGEHAALHVPPEHV